MRIIGGSADSLDTTKKALEELGVQYDLAYGIDVDKIARITGAFYEIYREAHPVHQPRESAAKVTEAPKAEEKKFLQPTAFIISPEKKVEVACYSSAHVGRISGKDVYTLVKYLKEESKQDKAA